MTTLQDVELGVLGPLQVRQHGLPVAVPGAKPRAILTMLGLHGSSVVSADTLAELLWGARPPRTAAKALQTHISSLRRTLGDGFVLTEGTGWTLSATEIDATRYQLAARLGREAIAGGDAPQAVARFDEALCLWRGIPELPDGARAISEKTRWIEGHAALVEDRADALLATGRAAEIVGELEAAIADAPLRERRWGQLMLALYRAGRQGEALGAYQRARSLLADELGVDPGPNLRRLEAAIVAQDTALEIPVSHQLSTVTRAVTFLLTDIEGSTAAWEAQADFMAVALARHDEIVEQVVTSRGGRLVKTRGEGDATFSVFDRPSAAAAAAIELQEAIRHEPWELANPMRIRVSLHTGEVELRDGDYFGRAVNRAARLRSLAAGGQILCSGATAELVIDSLSDDVILADLGKRQLKNLARPEHVFELRLETADDSRPLSVDAPMERPALPAVLASPGPFVGRGLELERLVSAWQTTLSAGTRAVLIAGEPGVGKTRLAGEWSRQAYDDGAVVLYGRCDEDLGAPYQPFAEALRLLVPCVGANRLRGLRGIEALLALVPGLTDALPDLAAPPRADPDTERYALFDAVVALLSVAASSSPVILVLDDLHWAAKPTLLLMRHLLRFGEHARVQIVGTYRSTDLDRSHPLAAMLADLHRDGSADRLTLGGLDENDVSAYVAEAGYDDEELGRALAAVTGGNPFFLIEALRHVDESGGRWDPSTLPQGVREAVSRRLSRLPAETNKALAAAAVAGSRFDVELVERVVEEDLVDAFDEARKAGILIEEPGGRYRFNHALVRQSLLAELASVRRMRLHQRIATALETELGADEDLLAELAYHYFECAWAGNATKAVEYCRRAADQAMARLAYEGAADLYDKALHALEELDDELPDRDDQRAELLITRCEALLAAGDVVTATGAVTQLQSAAGGSVRLAAWGVCFDGQLSMLTDPGRLDEIEVAVAAAAEKLAGLEDAAGEAKAHTVRADCLARLGRIGDCETALDQALTAARQAREHRRVNAVLAGAPLAALWGPNPVPRAGGRCLDVVRLLRITTGSPVVEATSTRCQGVLDAFRGRAAAGRQLIESARRTLTELGMRHALLEVDQFAGIVELVADEPAAAEKHLRRAYKGFRRMGLDVDTADTAALLARACLALEKNGEADELCSESERLAGHALKPSIAWRTVRAQLLARQGDHDGAKRVAEDAIAIAERTDELVDHGDACLALATVLGAAGDVAGARAAAQRAVDLYELKGAAALVEKARHVLGSETTAAPLVSETPTIEPENECVRALRRVEAAIKREAWSEVEQAHARIGSIESRRKIVGFERMHLPASEMASGAEKFIRDMRAVQTRRPIVAIRGERLALTRTVVGTADDTPGAPLDEMLQLVGLDEEGRIALQIWFDVEDLDAAMAELDAQHAQFEGAPARSRLENAASRAEQRVDELFADARWDEIGELLVDNFRTDDRRRGLRRESDDRATELKNLRAMSEIGVTQILTVPVAVRGNCLCLSRMRFHGLDSFDAQVLVLTEVNVDALLVARVAFDADAIDAAFAELESRYLAGEAAPHAQTWSVVVRSCAAINRQELPPATPDWANIDHRRGTPFAQSDMSEILSTSKDITPEFRCHIESVHALSDVGAVVTSTSLGTSQDGFQAEWRVVLLQTVEGDRLNRNEVFDEADIDTALSRFDALSRPAQRLDNAANRILDSYLSHYATRNWDVMAPTLAGDFSADDRRRVVSSGVRHGRDNEITNLKAMAELGCSNITTAPVAIRGERLVLARHSFIAPDWPELDIETIDVVEINTDNQIVAEIIYEADDLDAAFEELEARYLAGEAAPHAQTWSVAVAAFAALNRHELPAVTADYVLVDHQLQHATTEASGLTENLQASWDLTPNLRMHIESVHRLTELGTVITLAVRGTSNKGFDADWRLIELLTREGDLGKRCEVFSDTDLDAALTRFDELNRPVLRLENAVTRAVERFNAYFAARDWDGVAGILSDDVCDDDRRRVVNSGIQHGRDAQIANLRTIVDLGLGNYAPIVVATRGDHLALTRTQIASGDQSERSALEPLTVAEINSDGLLSATVHFDDFEDAIAEIDTRYVAGEAAPYAHTWSVVTKAYLLMNERGLPATTPDWVNIDHRRGATFAPGDMTAYIEAAWVDLAQHMHIYVEAVHRLSAIGTVVTQVLKGTSQEGFDAEWRTINLFTIEGDLFSRCELFDEDDIDVALAKFDELAPPATSLDNAASQAHERFTSCYTSRDWDGLAATMADDSVADDRRKFVGTGGTLLGRNAVVDHARVNGDLGVRNAVSTVIAVRGQRLALMRARFWGRDELPDAFNAEVLHMVEIDERQQIAHFIGFDFDDLEAAITELDARYVEGEAAPHARTWSVIAENCAALNQQLLPAPPDFVYVDRRRVASIGAGDVREFFRVVWELTPDLVTFIESVHRLSDVGAVVSQVAQGTSDDGFYAEWRVVNVFAVDGEHVSRCEVFDETDLDTAMARFDELSALPPQPQNAASRSMARFQEVLGTRDWDGMAEIFAEDICLYDRRPVVGVEFLGRDATIANMRASADTGVKNVTSTVVATRGGRLALRRVLINGRDERPEAFRTEALVIGEVNAQNRITAFVMFDLGDLDTAFNELDARYLADEGAANAQTYSVIADAFAAVNRHELPTTTTTDFVSVDHRRPIAFAPGEMLAYLQATLNDAPEIRIDIVTVHRLNSRGMVVSHAWHNTSRQGFDAEGRVISISMLEGGRINCCELYDESDLDAALARFEELSRPALRLQTAASKLGERFRASFAARDWDAMAELLADDLHYEDRRRVVNAGIRHGRDSMLDDMRSTADMGISEFTTTEIATRGERLVLVRAESCYDARPGAFYVENLAIAEIDADGRMTAQVMFDLDEADAAFEELDRRYVAGEAAPHADTWSVIADGYAAFNRREMPRTTPDWVNIDHRTGGSAFAPGDQTSYIHATWDVARQVRSYATAVHRLNALGAVVTQVTSGTSHQGFDVEWQDIIILTVDGNRLNRCEVFDGADLDRALAKFDELSRPAPRIENLATRIWARLADAFHRRDDDAYFDLTDPNGQFDDRRKGLRVSLDGSMRRRAVRTMFEFPESWRMEISHVAVRGKRLSLSRQAYRDFDEEDRPITLEVLTLTECSDENLVHTFVLFDPDNFDAAFTELETRYIAGEGAAHSHIWTLVNQTYARFNLHELSPTTPDWVNIDHRRGVAPEPGDMHAYVSAMWAVAPDVRTCIESVHRLTNLGAVFTHSELGTSQQGFGAEWHEITLLTFQGGLIDRCELFDENDLDSALATFDELSSSARLRENAVTAVLARQVDAFNRRDIDSYLALFDDDGRYDDRRKGLRDVGPIKPGYASAIVLEAGAGWQEEIECIAVRGTHLLLCRAIFRDHSEVDCPIAVEALVLAEVIEEGSISAFVVFDCDDIDDAFTALTARWIASGEVEHPDVIEAMGQLFDASNRHDWDALAAIEAGATFVNHRQLGTGEDIADHWSSLRMMASLIPDLRVLVADIAAYSANGVVTNIVVSGTTTEGAEIEIPAVIILVFDGSRLTRMEAFDLNQRDHALARFDELNG